MELSCFHQIKRFDLRAYFTTRDDGRNANTHATARHLQTNGFETITH